MSDTPLRVAMMLASDGPGGAEVMTFRLSEELRSRGHDVVYVGPQQGHGWLGDLYRAAKFQVELVPIGHSWVDVPFGRAIVAMIRKHRIDIVHSHEFEMAVYGAVGARITGISNIITLHGGLTVTRAWQRRLALRAAFASSAATTIISNATRHQFAADLGVPESTFTVVPNGVPATSGNAERVRAEFDCTHGELVLLAVGTLEKNKGHHVLLSALAHLQQRGLSVPWRLIIAGGRGGDQHESLVAFAQDNGLGNHVRIVTSRNDIPDLQALAHIFVMPSSREGMPMAVLEAMIAGNPVIASDTGGIPEAIADGQDGILVPPGNVEALAGALHRLMTNQTEREALGRRAYARAHRQFTVAVMADRYVELYRAARRNRTR